MELLQTIWLFIQDQILGMKWLNVLIGNLVSALGLDTASHWGGSIQFFIYDVIKITILLCTLIFIISYIQSYFPPERSKRILGRFHGIGANIIAALLGTVTPFCSCSSIPLFIGFTSAGLPLGVTFSFLISSPMVDLGSLVLLMSIFGAKIAIWYVVLGLIIAVAGGTLIEKLHMEQYVEEFIRNASSVDLESPTLTKRDRVIFAKDQVVSTFKKVFPTTGFPKAGFKQSSAATIPLACSWLSWWAFPCMRTSLAQFPWRRRCWRRAHSLAPSSPL